MAYKIRPGDDVQPPPAGGLMPEMQELFTPRDTEVSIGRRRLPTPPTSATHSPVPRSMTVAEVIAFRERLAKARSGQSSSATIGSRRLRGALGVISQSHNPLSLPIANPDDVQHANTVMTDRSRLQARAGGGDAVIMPEQV